MENKVEWNEKVDTCVTALQLVSNFAAPLTFCWIVDVLKDMQISVQRFQLLNLSSVDSHSKNCVHTFDENVIVISSQVKII